LIWILSTIRLLSNGINFIYHINIRNPTFIGDGVTIISFLELGLSTQTDSPSHQRSVCLIGF
jgi:acyl-[acyl carrier protein]--UDP-N-acetylglucosamine O-acyltransferase